MRLGAVVCRRAGARALNRHLCAGVTYIEVFQDGSPADWATIQAIPRARRTYSETVATDHLIRQSPMLVEIGALPERLADQLPDREKMVWLREHAGD